MEERTNHRGHVRRLAVCHHVVCWHQTVRKGTWERTDQTWQSKMFPCHYDALNIGVGLNHGCHKQSVCLTWLTKLWCAHTLAHGQATKCRKVSVCVYRQGWPLSLDWRYFYRFCICTFVLLNYTRQVYHLPSRHLAFWQWNTNSCFFNKGTKYTKTVLFIIQV